MVDRPRLLSVFAALLAVLCWAGLESHALAQGAAAQPAVADDGGREDAAEQEPGPAAASRALIEALRDPQAREALIRELERIDTAAPTQGSQASQGAAPGSAGTDAEAVPAVPEAAEEETAEPSAADPVSLGRQIALVTQQAAGDIAERVRLTWLRLLNAPRIFNALEDATDPEVILSALSDLLLVVAVTYAVYLALRAASRPLYRAMGRSAARDGLLRRIAIILGSTVMDAAVVVVSWGIGYGIMTAVFGEFGSIGLRQTLYLNAFLAVELTKVLIRAVLSPATEDLRLIGLGDFGAEYLTRWLSVVVAILGYGQLLAVPIVSANVSWFAGRAVSATLSVLVVLIAMGLVLRNRRRVARWLMPPDGRLTRLGILRFLARNWHVPTLVYLLALLVIVVTRPDGMLLPVLGTSGQILAAILAGMVVTAAMTRAIARGIQLPETVSKRLPLLERRLNAFVPSLLSLMRLGVFLAVVAFTAHSVGLIDVRTWLESRFGVAMTATLVSVVGISSVAFLIWLAFSSWVDYRLNPDYGRPATPREETLLTLLRNATTIAILVITAMFVLSEVGIDIAPLIASAGVLGLAIGFGAQRLVQDIITGIFIQFENAINVGDVVTTGGTTGTVERLTIRSVSLRDLDGTYHIIPFSSVDMVSNYMRGFAYHLCDMGVAYREDVDTVRDAMEEAFAELRRDPEQARNILGGLEYFGLVSFGDSALVVRARIKTRPGTQWAVGRAYNAVLKRVFDARGIEIPFPHRTVYFGEDREGRAPPLRTVVSQPEAAE